jgi:hypothetical protein
LKKEEHFKKGTPEHFGFDSKNINEMKRSFAGWFNPERFIQSFFNMTSGIIMKVQQLHEGEKVGALEMNQIFQNAVLYFFSKMSDVELKLWQKNFSNKKVINLINGMQTYVIAFQELNQLERDTIVQDKGKTEEEKEQAKSEKLRKDSVGSMVNGYFTCLTEGIIGSLNTVLKKRKMLNVNLFKDELNDIEQIDKKNLAVIKKIVFNQASGSVTQKPTLKPKKEEQEIQQHASMHHG